MKKLLLAGVALSFLYVPVASAAVYSADQDMTAIKKIEVKATKDADKKKRKRKHTGLDDGPNHK